MGRRSGPGAYDPSVPFLGGSDRLPRRPDRVVVCGTTGAGKTTVARRVAGVLGVPRVEIDALRHGPNWTPRASFVDDVTAFSAGPSWVTEWQYDEVRPMLVARADLMIWLDLPRATVMRQVVARTLRRRLHHEVLWNGNVEPPLRTILTDPDHIVRWAWSSGHLTAGRVTATARDRPALPVVRLRSRREIRRWLDGPLTAAALPA